MLSHCAQVARLSPPNLRPDACSLKAEALVPLTTTVWVPGKASATTAFRTSVCFHLLPIISTHFNGLGVFDRMKGLLSLRTVLATTSPGHDGQRLDHSVGGWIVHERGFVLAGCGRAKPWSDAKRGAQVARVTRRDALRMAAAAGLARVMGGPLATPAGAGTAGKLSPGYSGVVLAKLPVGYWRLGESAGPAAFDSSGSGYHGQYKGTPNFGQPGAIVNDPDTAIGCKGPDSKDYVEILDPGVSAEFSQPTSGLGLTVEVWMRPDALTFPGLTSEIYIHWLGKCVSGSGQCEWGLRFYSQDSPSRPNRISAYIWNPEGGEGTGAYFQFGVNDDEALVEGNWYHIVAVYEPGDKDTVPPAGVRIYKNGVKKQGPPSSGTLYTTYGIVPVHGTLPLRLGTRDAATSGNAAISYLKGGLDGVAIYPYALDDPAILENYNAGISP